MTSQENEMELGRHGSSKSYGRNPSIHPLPTQDLVNIRTSSQENGMELGHANGSSKDYDRSISGPAAGENPELDDDGHPRRRGTAMTASFHVVTAVIGAGVLSLPWSVGQLGWVAGPLVLLGFALVTLYTSDLLADNYRYPDPVTGTRNYKYLDAVKVTLGEKNAFWCGIVQYSNLVGTSIGYTITSAVSMAAVQRSDCFHYSGHSARCHVSNNPYMAAFGACQLLFSQIPDFDRIWCLSAVAAFMSIFYSTVALGLGIAKSIEGDHSHGTVQGVSIGNHDGDVTRAQRAWYSFQALGNIAFAYTFSPLLIEIQDTLRGPPQFPPENKTMKKTICFGIMIPTFFYTAVAATGYLAFGDDVPHNILTGFGFYSPFWLVDLANVAVVIHLVGAYQVFSQPVFAAVENKVRKKWPNSKFIHDEISFSTKFNGQYLVINKFRVAWRSSYVIFTTLIATLLPFFNDVTGLIGALSFWPLTVYFPVKMFIEARKIKPWSGRWIALQTVSLVSLIFSVAASVGSGEGIVNDLKHYKPFSTREPT